LKSFRKRQGIDLERELRSSRPEPRPEFVAMIGDRVAGSRSRRSPVRVAVGAALTAAMLAAVAAVGGVGYAASAAQDVAKTVVRVTHVSHPRVINTSAANATSAAAQYGAPMVKVCYKGRVIQIPRSQLKKFKNRGAKVTSGKVGSKCSFRAGRKGRQHGAPAFTG
jgi:hypothetical protein